MKTRLDLATHHYFPFHFIVLGVIFMAQIIIPIYYILSISLGILGLLIVTTHYRLVIDTQNRTYREYLWILGMKMGKFEAYQDVEYVYINRTRQNVEYGFVARVHADRPIYMGYIKFSGQDSVFIGESRKEEKTQSKVEKIAEFLSVEIIKNY